jgi:hypothetical protein
MLFGEMLDSDSSPYATEASISQQEPTLGEPAKVIHPT